MRSIAFVLVLIWTLLLAGNAKHAVAQRPNVILIFIDDMGFGDVGFNGATGPKTPRLDQMARQGRQFRDFYVGCAVCSGSRTALMTGTHYQRLSMAPVLFPDSQQGLHPDEVTIADMLLEAGYRTKCVGKWHLGHLPPCLPTYQGFESYYGIPYSNDMWIDPANQLADDVLIREGLTLQQVKAGHRGKNQVPLMRDEKVIEYPVDQTTITQRYTEEAIRFIREHKDEPFFLYLPHTMVHRPLAVSKAFENRTGKLIWDAIEEVDWSVGQLLDTVAELGIDEKTLVIFTSDNGAAVGSSLPLRGKKASVYDGGIREPTVMWWPGTIPAGTVCQEVTASIDILPTLAKLCGGKLPERQIDGHDIGPLIVGQEGAVSPHQPYCLSHGRGAVRYQKWKFYPWAEGQERAASDSSPPENRPAVQLYDTLADIGETRNLAEQYPDVVQQLNTAWLKHQQELAAHRRPTAKLIRPADAKSPGRPGEDMEAGPALNWKNLKQGSQYRSSRVSNLVNQAFQLDCRVQMPDNGAPVEGVIIAQGGTLTGYSLYVKNEELVFAVRKSDQEIHRVRTALPTEKQWRVAVSVLPDRLQLQVAGKPPVAETCVPLLVRHPSEELSIGFDSKQPVDPASPGAVFNAAVDELNFQLLDSNRH